MYISSKPRDRPSYATALIYLSATKRLPDFEARLKTTNMNPGVECSNRNILLVSAVSTNSAEGFRPSTETVANATPRELFYRRQDKADESEEA